MWRLGYRPALNGVRGVAILLVVVAHMGLPVVPNGGGVGVTLFFVLSGFLITALLVHEHDDTERVNLGGFYARRVRRLFPALALVLGLSLLLNLVRPDQALWVASYLGNWARVGGEELRLMGHTWSLAIEEQFYLVWPLLFVFAPRKVLLWATVAAVPAILVVRCLLWEGPESVDLLYFSTFSRIDAILLGCAAALMLTRVPVRVPGWLAGVAVGVLGWSAWWENAASFYTWGLSLIAAASVVLVVWAATSEPKWLKWRPLAWCGLIAYGLYLLHPPVFWMVEDRLGWGIAYRVVAVVVAFVLAAVMYVGWERRWLSGQSGRPVSREPV